MKKSLHLSIAFLIFGNLAIAQDSTSFHDLPYNSRNSGSFHKSARLLSFGLGVPNIAGNYHDNRGFPPLYVKFESGFLRDEVGVGGYVSSAWGTTNAQNNIAETNFSAFSVGILGYYHFNRFIPIKEMDVYGASGLAYRAVYYNDYYNNTYIIQFIWHLGIRYYIRPKFSIYLESGYDAMSQVNFGITLKLK